MRQYEVEESNFHLREVWKIYARLAPNGETFESDGLSFANGNHPWCFMNLAMLNRPIGARSDLDRRATRAIQYFAAPKNPWLFTASGDWLGANARRALSAAGLEYKFDWTGMVAERLLEPTRPLPDVQLRRIGDEETRLALADLNADAYGVPRDWTRQTVGSAALWQMQPFGTLAYINGRPASGAFALPIEKALYVAWVATAQEHRKLGLAELVIRKSLDAARRATGMERTVLHATNDGFPVYLRMGYRPLVKFPFYGPKQDKLPEFDNCQRIQIQNRWT